LRVCLIVRSASQSCSVIICGRHLLATSQNSEYVGSEANDDLGPGLDFSGLRDPGAMRISCPHVTTTSPTVPTTTTPTMGVTTRLGSASISSTRNTERETSLACLGRPTPHHQHQHHTPEIQGNKVRFRSPRGVRSRTLNNFANYTPSSEKNMNSYSTTTRSRAGSSRPSLRLRGEGTRQFTRRPPSYHGRRRGRPPSSLSQGQPEPRCSGNLASNNTRTINH
jgi:hypothetical protein